MQTGVLHMAVKKIITFNDQALRRRSRPVEVVDERIRGIFADMADTLYSKQSGGGLAACQIGILRRLVIADTGRRLLRLVNPQIISAEGEQTGLEGCLSFPGIWGVVKRPAKIVVAAINHHGRPVKIAAAGELARCLCHEIDHLDGIVITDRIIDLDIKENQRTRFGYGGLLKTDRAG
jgi:peptide deformylase